MSNATSFENALGLLARDSERRKRRDILSAFRLLLEAMREGHAAAQRYQQLTRGGIPPDAAVHQVFAEIYART
jgi:hypothetical protein